MTGHTEDIELGQIGQKKKDKNASMKAPEDTDYQPVNWKKLLLSPKYIPWHILFIIIGILTIIITINHDSVVEKLRPFSEKVRDLPAGWLIPIVILIIISFPPLFGHEIIALLCGVIYGLWIGFAIVAAGTFIGEVGTWFAFLYLLRNKAAKLERTNLNYGALARLTRDGGFWIVLVIRFSAIPSHFSTAVFATCGVKFWSFGVATLFSLPKQIFLVYLGVIFIQKQKDSNIKTVVFVLVFIATAVMAGWIWWKMRGIKKVLLEEQAERRAAKLKREESSSIDSEWTGVPGSSHERPSSQQGLVAQQNEYQPPPMYSRPEDPSASDVSLHPGYSNYSHPGYPRESIHPGTAEMPGMPGRAYY